MSEPFIKIIVGLGYGDEGKGALCDSLTREVDGETLVVRYNGGPQAAHNVVTPSGLHHTFSQYGSGTLAGASTYLSEYMVVNPGNLLRERKHLIEDCDIDSHKLDTHMYVNKDCKIILPWHIIANQAKESLRGADRHGSCGQGVGECMKEAASHRQITVGQFLTIRREEMKTRLLKYEEFRLDILAQAGVYVECCDIDAFLDEIYNFLDVIEVVSNDGDLDWLFDTDRTNLIFEGAQGVMLDQDHGWFPFVTYSRATQINALELLDKASNSAKLLQQAKVMGVIRGYHTRHGAGPFPTVIDGLDTDPGGHNNIGPWQGEFRVGHLDIPMLRYAALACGFVDEIAVTCLDHVEYPTFVVNNYYNSNVPVSLVPQDRPADLEQKMKVTEKLLDGDFSFEGKKVETEEELLDMISRATFAPVTSVSHGPTAEDRTSLKQPGLAS